MPSPSVHHALLTVTANEYTRCTPPAIDLDRTTTPPIATTSPPLSFTNVPPDSALNLDVLYQGDIRLVYHRDKHDLGPMYSKMNPADVARLFPTLPYREIMIACRRV